MTTLFWIKAAHDKTLDQLVTSSFAYGKSAVSRSWGDLAILAPETPSPTIHCRNLEIVSCIFDHFWKQSLFMFSKRNPLSRRYRNPGKVAEGFPKSRQSFPKTSLARPQGQNARSLQQPSTPRDAGVLGLLRDFCRFLCNYFRCSFLMVPKHLKPCSKTSRRCI